MLGLGQHAQALEGLVAALRGAGYTREALDRETSLANGVATPALRGVVAHVQAERDGPLPLLVRLFSLGAGEARERVERALPDVDLEGLAAVGVVTLDGDRVRPVLQIGEAEGLLVAWDLNREREDWVIGVSPSTMLAATHTPRVERARTALDVGAGQGLHALLAARHCDRVIATDFNPRALWMTELNARLNGIDNVETREGSFFDPVEGERFDLVVVNPPYVISPGARFLYRDGGFEGDTLCHRMLADLPSLLEDGGFATLQCNWIHAADERWFAPIERGLAGSGCDALMARTWTSTPLQYAATWNEAHHDGDPQGFGRVLREWVEHFDANGVERVSGAMVVLRRRSDAANWRRAVSLARHPERLGGAALVALFDAQQRLAELDDDALLDTHLVAPPELRVERYQRPGGKPSCVLDLDEAVGVRRPVDPPLASLVLKLDGSRPLRAVTGGSDQVAGVRALIKLGFVAFA